MLFKRYSQQIPGYGAAVIAINLDIDIVIYNLISYFFYAGTKKMLQKITLMIQRYFGEKKNKKYLQMIIKINKQIIKMKANFSADFL